MDQYSPAELSELYLLANQLIDTQFQYWITITFAVVVAGFVVGERITQRFRYVVAVLYWLATTTLFLRWLGTSGGAGRIITALEESDAIIFEGDLVIVALRVFTFVAGTAAASYFLLKPKSIAADRN